MAQAEQRGRNHLIMPQSLIVRQASDYGEVNGVLVFRTRNEDRATHDLIATQIPVRAEPIARRSPVPALR
jgi:hypothetical protein